MKILDVTGNPFSKFLNNGKTHEAIFSSFSKEELCQLYVCPVSTELIDFEFCSSYYSISDWDVINKLFLKTRKCGEVVSRKSKEQKGGIINYSNVSNKKIGSKNGLFGIIRDVIWATNVWKNRNLKHWLEAESIDVIFLDGGGDSYIYNIGLYVSELLNIPMIYYATDDYIIYPIQNSILQKAHHKFVTKTVSKIVSKAVKCYAIGEKMAKDYSCFFNKPFDYIMNSIHILPYLPSKTKESGPIIVSYFGSLGLNRGNMIAELGKLSKGRLIINVYAFNIFDDINQKFKESGVEYKGSVKGEELDQAMYNSDVLLHVESDDLVNRAFTKLAVSTKIPEYLMHSRLVLGYGPSEVASMELLKDHEIGLVVSSDDSEQLKEESINKLLDQAYRDKIVKRGYTYAISHYDKRKNAEAIRRDFESLLLE